MTEPRESATFLRMLDGRLETMHARFTAHRYPRHAHDYLLLGYIQNGVQSYDYRGEKRGTPSGLAFVVNPEEPHTGEAATRQPYVMHTLCAPDELLSELIAGTGISAKRARWDVNVVHDEALSWLLHTWQSALSDPGQMLRAET